MKRFIPHFLVLILVTVLVVSCEKGETDLASIGLGINPNTDKNGLNRALQLQGRFYDSIMPPATDFTPKLLISTGISEIDMAVNTTVYIPFSVTSSVGPLPPGPVVRFFNMKVFGADGYWKMQCPPSQKPSNLSFSFLVPRLVQEGNFSIIYNAEVVYAGKTYVTDFDTVGLTNFPLTPCSDSLEGKVGLGIRKFDLGPNKGKVKVRYNTGNDPDRVDLKYGEEFIFSTGTKLLPGHFPNCGSDGMVKTGDKKYKDFIFDYDPAKSRFLTVYGFGSCEFANTRWAVTVFCPE